MRASVRIYMEEEEERRSEDVWCTYSPVNELQRARPDAASECERGVEDRESERNSRAPVVESRSSVGCGPGLMRICCRPDRKRYPIANLCPTWMSN